MYGDATTFDNVDLSDVQLPGGLSMPVVSKFKYLGDYRTFRAAAPTKLVSRGSSSVARPG